MAKGNEQLQSASDIASSRKKDVCFAHRLQGTDGSYPPKEVFAFSAQL